MKLLLSNDKKINNKDILILNIFEFRMLRQLTRLGARSGVTCRSMKTQGGQGDRGHVPTAFNHKDGVVVVVSLNKKMILCLIQRKLKLWLIQKMQLSMLSHLLR